ncbi:MAG: aldo/keto reductase family oxidoreductase [Solirubrobacterales bacterium]|nr:aldo/keto reductase family oxidoreductase [Solirubrobacterales bacterium]
MSRAATPPIPARVLGAGGPSPAPVGAIGLGCMGMSWAYGDEGRDEKESVAVIHRALELGVTLIDTSDMYGPFTNEELVGRALAGRREQAVLATKGGLVVGKPPAGGTADPHAAYGINRVGRPEHLRSAFDASLRRLQVDHVDLYQLHRVDPEVPIEDSWGAMAEFVDAGKARMLGLSEVSVEELERAHAIHPVASVQSELSLWTRGAIDDGVLAWCAEHGASFIPFSPLGRGFLTGAITAASFDEDDFRAKNPRFTPEALAANLKLVDVVKEVAARLQATPAQVALAWVLDQGEHVVPIPGTRRLGRLEENAGAARLTLDAEARGVLNALPAPTGARY